MSVSLRLLAERVDDLKRSPGTFEGLVLDVLKNTDPTRYAAIQTHGHYVNEVPAKGWPDAYAIRDDGRMDVVEVTHSPDWKDHLRDDLKKIATASPPVSGFTFVAWAHTPRPAESAAAQQKLVDRGVPPAGIRFVFREELVALLADSRCRRVVDQRLKLSTSVRPFEDLNKAASVFVGPSRLPRVSWADHDEARVYEPAIAMECRDDLARDWICLVEGPGAVGKTTLAITLAMGHQRSGGQSLYLDFATHLDRGGHDLGRAAEDAFTRLADEGCLFVLDNVHLRPDVAREIVRHWAGDHRKSRILVLGRSIDESIANTVEAVSSVQPRVRRLTVAVATMQAVYTHVSSSGETPSTQQLENWLGWFEADLVAFSVAVQRVRDKPGRRIADLTPTYAVDNVREVYLPPGSRENHNLCLVAALMELELETPVDVLDDNGLADAVTRCIVVLNREHDRYRFGHPSVGKLVLAAARNPEKRADLLGEAAGRRPAFAHLIAARLELAGRAEDAGAILTKLASDQEDLFEGILATAPPIAWRHVERLDRLGVLTIAESVAYLATCTDAMREMALRHLAAGFVSLIRSLRTTAPAFAEELLSGLAAPNVVPDVAHRLTQFALGDVAAFLRFTSAEHPGLDAAVRADLAAPDRREALLEAANRSTLEGLRSFLVELPAVADPLIDALAAPGATATLLAGGLQRNITDIPSFLAFTRVSAPRLHAPLLEHLATDEAVAELAQAVQQLRPAAVARFLHFARVDLPEVAPVLAARLAEPDVVRTMTEAAMSRSLGRSASWWASWLGSRLRR